MLTTILGIVVDIITLRWDSKCAQCGAVMPAGTEAAWYPDSKWSHGGTRYVKTVEGAVVRNADWRTMVDDAPVAAVSTPTVTRIVKERSAAGYRGTVMHLPNQPCQSEYAVKAVYDATAKTLKVSAYEAETALQVVMKQLQRGNYSAKPSAYIVYQGNVVVLTHAVGSKPITKRGHV